MSTLHDQMLCPICKNPMVHSRLRGYYCAIERHNEIVREYEMGQRFKGNLRRILADDWSLEDWDVAEEREDGTG